MKRPRSLEYPRESHSLSLSRFMSNLFPLIAPLKKDEEPGAAQLRRERGTSHLMFISYKSLMAFYLSILRCKPETLQKDKQRLHFKKTAVAGSGCALSDSFRNNKHRLLTQQTHHGGVAPTRSAWARQGSLKESRRKRETPSENKHFSWDEHLFLFFFFFADVSFWLQQFFDSPTLRASLLVVVAISSHSTPPRIITPPQGKHPACVQKNVCEICLFK